MDLDSPRMSMCEVSFATVAVVLIDSSDSLL